MQRMMLPETGRRRFLYQGIALGAGGLLGNIFAFPAEASETRRRLRFSYIMTNPGGCPLLGQRFWLYLPVARGVTQHLSMTQVTAAHTLHSDTLGHNFLEVVVEVLPPYAQKFLSVTVEVITQETPREVVEEGGWLASERFIESDAESIIRLAEHLRRAKPLETARAIYDWVSTNLHYAGYLADDYGALYALARRRGDCTEYAYLVVALARACGVPARMVGGYVSNQDGMPRPEEYHNWAELYWGGTWHLVDAQKENWLSPAEHYIAFRYYRAGTHNPLGGAHRFSVEGEMVVRAG